MLERTLEQSVAGAIPYDVGQRPASLDNWAELFALLHQIGLSPSLAAVAPAVTAYLIGAVPCAKVGLTVWERGRSTHHDRCGGTPYLEEQIHRTVPSQAYTMEVAGVGDSRASLSLTFLPGRSIGPGELCTLDLLVLGMRAALDRADARAATARFDATFSGAPVGLAHVALDGTFLLVNDEFCRIAGHHRDDLLAGGFQPITHPEDLELDIAHVGDLLAGRADRYTMEKRYLRAGGAIIWINLTVSIVRATADNDGFFVAVIEDVSEVRRARREATHDPLTGLLNRRGLSVHAGRVLEAAIERRAPVSATYLDLDGFKAVNDARGHAEGDRLLTIAASVLRQGTGPDDVIARVGGDEMVVILAACSLEQGRSIAQRLRNQLLAMPDTGGGIHASLGVAAIAANSPADLPRLVEAADRAMLAVKQAGRVVTCASMTRTTDRP